MLTQPQPPFNLFAPPRAHLHSCPLPPAVENQMVHHRSGGVRRGWPGDGRAPHPLHPVGAAPGFGAHADLERRGHAGGQFLSERGRHPPPMWLRGGRPWALAARAACIAPSSTKMPVLAPGLVLSPEGKPDGEYPHGIMIRDGILWCAARGRSIRRDSRCASGTGGRSAAGSGGQNVSGDHNATRCLTALRCVREAKETLACSDNSILRLSCLVLLPTR